jgi:hypothetical protein
MVMKILSRKSTKNSGKTNSANSIPDKNPNFPNGSARGPAKRPEIRKHPKARKRASMPLTMTTTSRSLSSSPNQKKKRKRRRSK